MATRGHHYDALGHWRRTAAQWGVMLRCSANGGRAVVLGLEISAERKRCFGRRWTLRVESGSLVAQGSCLFGKGRTTQQIPRRFIAVAGSEDRSEEDR